VGGCICVGIFALYTKIWEWFEEKDPANSWLSFPLVAIIISAIAWVLDNLF
jgi:phosphate/sulfate permease